MPPASNTAATPPRPAPAEARRCHRAARTALLTGWSVLAAGCIVTEVPVERQLQTMVVRPVETAVQDATAMVLASLAYRDLNGRWPGNLAELRAFCVAHPGTGDGIGWDQFSAATFTPRPDGGLRVECTVLPARPDAPPSSVAVDLNPEGRLRQP